MADNKEAMSPGLLAVDMLPRMERGGCPSSCLQQRVETDHFGSALLESERWRFSPLTRGIHSHSLSPPIFLIAELAENIPISDFYPLIHFAHSVL